MSRILALWVVCFLVFTSSPAQAQVLDGSRNPQAFSDREALGILFTVVRSWQPAGWDLATRQKYLTELGLTAPEAFRVIQAAHEWFGQIQALDTELRELVKSSAGRALDPPSRQKADELASAKLALLEESLTTLRLQLGLEGAARLDRALMTVKRGMKAYVAGTPPKTIQRPAPAHH